MRIVIAFIVAVAAILLMKGLGILSGDVIVMSGVAGVIAGIVAFAVSSVPRVVVGLFGIAIIALGLFWPALSEMAAMWFAAVTAAVLLGLTFAPGDKVSTTGTTTHGIGPGH